MKFSCFYVVKFLTNPTGSWGERKQSVVSMPITIHKFTEYSSLVIKKQVQVTFLTFFDIMAILSSLFKTEMIFLPQNNFVADSLLERKTLEFKIADYPQSLFFDDPTYRQLEHKYHEGEKMSSNLFNGCILTGIRVPNAVFRCSMQYNGNTVWTEPFILVLFFTFMLIFFAIGLNFGFSLTWPKKTFFQLLFCRNVKWVKSVLGITYLICDWGNTDLWNEQN